MYEKAIYYRSQFMRRSFLLLMLSVFFVFGNTNTDSNFHVIVIVFPVAALIWFGISRWIGLKLKRIKNEDPVEISTRKSISYKSVEFVLTLALGISLVASMREWSYANLFLYMIILIYLVWLVFQMNSLRKYFLANKLN